MKAFKQSLALVLAVALILSFSTMTFAVDPTPADVAFYYDSLSYAEPIHGKTRSMSESYNYDMEEPGWRDDFVAEAYPKSITLSNTTDFSAQISGTAQPHPENSSRILFSIVIDLQHNPHDLEAGATYSTEVTLTLQNGKSATYTHEIKITNKPILSQPEFYDNGQLTDWDLTAGKTYEARTGIVDKANLLAGEETRIRLYIDEDDSSHLQLVNGLYSDTAPLKFKALKMGTVSPRFCLEKRVGSDWDEIYDMGWTMDITDGTETAVDPIANSALDAALSAATGSGSAKTATLNMSDTNVLTPDGLAYLKAQAASAGVSTVTLKPENDNVTLSFNPADLDSDVLNGNPFTASVRSTRPSEIASITGLTQNTAGSWVDFDFSGILPAPMKVTVKIDPNDYPLGITADDFRIWYYNAATGSMEQKNIAVDYDETVPAVSFTLEHFSAYMVLDSGSVPVARGTVTPASSTKGGKSGEVRAAAIQSDYSTLSSGISGFNKAFEQLANTLAVFAPANSAEANALVEKAKANGLETVVVNVMINGEKTPVTLPMLTVHSNVTNHFTTEQISLLRGKRAVIRVLYDGSEYVFYAGNIAPEEATRILYPFEYLARVYRIDIVK